MLAGAFHDDPHMRWVVRHSTMRMQRLERLFAAVFLHGYALPRDECYVQKHLVGAALWMPPDTWRTSPLAQLRMLPAMTLALRGDLLRLLTLSSFTEKKHPSEPAHWYLS
jgi:hypothetical protein